MEVHLTPEQQQLTELASQRGRNADTLAQESISRYLAEEARFVEAVRLAKRLWIAANISHMSKWETASTACSGPDA
jgi:hypothetical protein